MVWIFADLDNTLLYSYKHDIGADKILVEMRQSRPQGYMTRKTYEYLAHLKKSEKMAIVPVTSRDKEHYDRIFGVHNLLRFPSYSIVLNGGILLVDGKEVYTWTQETQEMVRDSLPEIEAAVEFMEADPECGRKWQPNNLIVFCESSNPKAVAVKLEETLDMSKVHVYYDEHKVYVHPSRLSKGTAVERFVRRFGASATIGAGDFELTDASMLNAVSQAIIPYEFAEDLRAPNVIRAPKGALFSDFVCDTLKRMEGQYA